LRGSSQSAALIWDESLDLWTAGLSGSTSVIITEAGVGLTKSGNTLSVDTTQIVSTLAGDGLISNGGSLDVNVGNGLSIVSDLVFLGGTLSQTTTIDGGLFDLTMSNTTNFLVGVTNSGNISLDATDDGVNYGSLDITGASSKLEVSFGGSVSLIYAGFDQLFLETSDGISTYANFKMFQPGNTQPANDGSVGNSMLIDDNISNKGLVYLNDYSPNFTTYSLVTKGYVDSVSGSGLSGSGTNNYVPYWTGIGSLSSTSSIFDNGKVGILTTNPSASLHIVGDGSMSVLKVDGNSGELFSINDSLVGSLFSVNDISGLPILEVFSDNTLLMGDFQSRGLYTTKKTSVISGNNPIYYFATASYDGAFVDYTAFDGSNARSGSLNAIWLGNQIQYTETSTLDIGTTSGLTFSFVLSGTYAVLSVDATSNWTVKSIIRSI
jgi:hypothetical protein